MRSRSAALLVVVALRLESAAGCTVIAVTPEASADGATLVTHTDDAEGAGDPRPTRVPAADHPPNARRVVHANVAGYDAPVPIGHIDEVPHTYAYYRTAFYGMLNEKQVVLGESTCSSVSPLSSAKPVHQGGKALLGMQSLTHLALERCADARCAAETAGLLAEAHGFYQDEETPTGEAFAAGDPHEVWLFHVLPDSTGASAVWAAARLPPGHIAVVANMFTIRRLNLSDTANFLASRNIEAEAERAGWERGTPLDFTAVFSAGEYVAKHYSGRRVWRALSLLAPNETFSPSYDDLRRASPYPTSTPARGLRLADVTRTMRDFYAGTPYDLTKGLAAGPWASPNRYGLAKSGMGTWERPISIFRCDHSYVGQARAWLPGACGGTLWFGPHNPHGTVYVPLAIGMERLPPEYVDWAAPDRFDRRGAFWAHSAAQSLAEARFAWIQPELTALSAQLEARGLAVQAEVDASFEGDADVERLTRAYEAHARAVARRAWGLVEQLLYRYADAYLHGDTGKPSEPKALGYPLEWLKAVDYPGELPEAAVDAALAPPAVHLLAHMPPPEDTVDGYTVETLGAISMPSARGVDGSVVAQAPPDIATLPTLLVGVLLGATATATLMARWSRQARPRSGVEVETSRYALFERD